MQSLTPLLVAGVDDAVAALGGDLQRLLDDDVLAGLRGGDGRLQVGAARRGDDDDVHVGPGQDGGQVGDNVARRGRVRRPASAALARLRLTRATSASTGHLGQGAGVKAGDHAAADDGEADA